MNVSKTNEQAFEALIERALVGSTCEERKQSGNTDIDTQCPDADKFYWGNPSDMDKTLAIDQRRLWSFLEATQQTELNDYRGRDLYKQLPKVLSQRIATVGIIDVLRNGIDVDNIHLSLFYAKPSYADSAESHRLYAQNQFSVTRQQTFSVANPGLEIDIVLYVNGLPLFTFELKNPWTGQTARYDGQKQYRSVERNPKETLLNFGRCLAHFTLDMDEVYFTTRLNGKDTYFMPFNKGLPDGQGAGNPVNIGSYKTAYLWEEVLTKDTISDIIMNYVLFDYDEAKTQKKVVHIMKNAKKLIFPRYHQLDVVNKLIADASTKGVGERYLIEHSAGSGKSNSLTWLAYKLIATCPVTPDAKRAKGVDQQLFNSVIVVTDRRILDRQITDNIRAFGKTDKIVAHADNSKELSVAIENNKRIIITTIQKFPYICDTISDVSDRNFAIIIDEAHSSQSGIAADKMNATVEKDKDTDGADTDALIEKLIKDRKMSSNCSYFAFTATPKKETLERFGIENAEGKFSPFHLYSMKQAIEEGFILDVLTNYTTYRSYYELSKSCEGNPEYQNAKAQKALRRMVEREPKTIAAKAGIMLDHFDAKIFRNRKLSGKAKAMVVTKDIECAIEYYNALNILVQERRLPYKILVSFSDKKTLKGKEYTEAELNGFPDSKTPETFDTEEYRILVVANKYLTGFDQPKLCAIYIDKPLDGVLAVQALSRLNRAAPDLGKRSEDLFVLDFYNTTESMKNAFDPYYTGTALAEATNINVLNDLKSALLDMGVFDMDEVNEFSELFFKNADSNALAPILDLAAHRFCHEIEWDDNGKPDFKMKCKQFVRVYSKAAAIMEYERVDWEKLHWYLRLLIPKLFIKDPTEEDLKDLLNSVDLSTYGLRRTALNQSVALDSNETVLDPNKPVMVNGGNNEDPKTKLDQLIRDFNERWFKGWDATPEEQKAKLISLVKSIVEDKDYQDLVVGNPDTQAVEDATAKIIDRIVRRNRKGDMSLYHGYNKNEQFRHDIQHLLVSMIENLDYLNSKSYE